MNTLIFYGRKKKKSIHLTCSCPHTCSCHQTALNQLVWIISHNFSVLTGSWFPFISINHKILWPARKTMILATHMLLPRYNFFLFSHWVSRTFMIIFNIIATMIMMIMRQVLLTLCITFFQGDDFMMDYNSIVLMANCSIQGIHSIIYHNK